MSKRDLSLPSPLLNAAGTLGFRPKPDLLAGFELGAFITNPISWRPRGPARSATALDYPGGLLLHTGLPNPGFSALIRTHARAWAASPIPIIVHLMADRPEETRRMVQALEGLDNVIAVELGFAPLLSDDLLLTALELAYSELPLIVCLPWDQALRLGPRLVQFGASAVSLAAPRGAWLTLEGEWREGRLYGPSLLPHTLELVRRLATIGVPTIGSGGIYRREHLRAMLDAGALAVQLDTVLWRGGLI